MSISFRKESEWLGYLLVLLITTGLMMATFSLLPRASISVLTVLSGFCGLIGHGFSLDDSLLSVVALTISSDYFVLGPFFLGFICSSILMVRLIDSEWLSLRVLNCSKIYKAWFQLFPLSVACLANASGMTNLF
ncbi:hypothetical protein C1752_12225 [Acaryochloris thomasi RCC1774]|uniref:Uncharacterized protein n=1 Tax=Acaryochloris thomasi RCC1774 TaxID=1764569 RepID=A0A2W1JGZ8_9CYAN|nr:hypothetical protein C1752_12225 [Acaryochloris thomasi RCC1774]